MPDILFPSVVGAQRKLKDMGDGSYAEVMATTPFKLAAASTADIATATGADMTAFSDITIICDVAPSVPGRVMIGEDGVLANARYVALIDQQGNLLKDGAATISAAKTSYSLFEGNCWVWIVGATGGAYRIKGSN